MALSSNCLTDVFSVSGQSNLPVICGTMTGEHVYYDPSDLCNELLFTFGDTAVGVTDLAARSFSIKITQFSCDFNNLAPFGCDQYFFGAPNGFVQSFNFQNARHLSRQSQDICIR